LTVKDVCQRLRLRTSRVNELIRTGALPSYKIGRSRRIDPSDLAEFLSERRKRSQRTATSDHDTKRAAVSGRSWLEDFQREAYGQGSDE
jgi:excisionase family DNA binding protein